METNEQLDKADCVVAVCKCGGATIMCVTEYMSKETRKELGDAAANGCDIKHMPAEEVRKMDFGCKCQSASSQPELLF